MRFLSALLLSVLLSPLALSQTKPMLERKAELEFGDRRERIVIHKFLAGENRLLLVGKKTIRVLDVASLKFSESRPLEVPEFNEEKPRLSDKRLVSKADWSSDGKALYVIGADGKSVALWGLPGN